MDIAKYIVKFLIKNKYCSLPGLGSFELNKISAAVNTQKGEIIPAKYEVKFSPLGSIDDTFASFVGSHENVSISNTSNNIKEFCRNAKEEIAQNGRFVIENLGFLTMQGGKLTFVQTDELDMGAEALPLPPIDTNLRANQTGKLDFSYPAAQTSYRRKKLSLGKFMMPALLILIIAIGSFVAYRYIADNQKKSNNETQQNDLPIGKDTMTNPAVDTNSASAPVANAGVNPLYKVAIYQTTVEAAANARSAKLKKNGNLSEVQSINGNFIVTVLASHPSNDTTRIVDSLRRFFGVKGQVYILP